MFFFVLMSQLVGSPFMLETRFRSAVPPHMGQSPLPGSERADIVAATPNEPSEINPTARASFLGIIGSCS